MHETSTLQQQSRFLDPGNLRKRDADTTTFRFCTDEGWPLEVEASALGVFRLTIGEPEQPDGAASQAMLLARDEAVAEAEIQKTDDGWRIEQGELVLEIRQNPLQLYWWRGDTCVLRMGSAEVPALARAAEEPALDVPQWRLHNQLEGSPLYGLGEDLEALDRRGRVLASDVATDRVLPLAWSPRGWGLHVNTIERVVHHVDATEPDAYCVDVAGNFVEIFVYLGEPADIFNQYSQICGRAGQPPLWALGIWLRQAPEQSPEEALKLALKLREQGVGIETLSFDDPPVWEVRAKQASEWDTSRFADGKGWLQEAQEADLRVCLPTYPGLPFADDSEAMLDLEDRGWLLTGDDGLAKAIPGGEAMGGRDVALLDLTHRDVFNTWCERNRQLFDDGVDAMAVTLPDTLPDDLEPRNRAPGARLRQLYPLLVTRNLFDAAAWHKVPPEGVVWHRALSPISHRFPMVAGPAVPNTWEGLATTLTAALTTGASGLPLQSHELGSQDFPLDTLDAELYVRWLMMAVFSGHFRMQGIPQLHPEAFDEDTQFRIQTWLDWRYRLVPYVLGAIEDAARNGLPVQRSMPLAFPNDEEALNWPHQYLLGPALLVTPLLRSGDEVEVYFPEGEAWWDLATGWRYEGGTHWTFPCPNGHVPVFGREGHILCLGTGGRTTADFNSARLLEEVWLFGMPEVSPSVMRNKIRVMQMQGSSYIKGLEGLKILPSEGLEVKRRGAEVRISRER